MFLLSGLFCCLSFSGVFFVLLFGRVRVLFFAVWAGARAPPKQQKRRPRPNSKKINKHAPAPSERVFFLLFGRVGVFFLAVWAGCVFFFAVWAGVVFFFALWAGACFFAVWVMGVSFLFFAVWARVVFFFAVWAGGVFFLFFGCLGGEREFTHLPVCLARLQATHNKKRPNSKKKKKNTSSLG